MDLVARILFTLLLFLLPFSFAGAEPWAFCALQGVGVLLMGGILFSRKRFLRTGGLCALLTVGGVLLGLGLIQLCFSATLLDGPQWRPVTLSRLFTVHHLSFLLTWLSYAWLVCQLYPSFDDSRRLVGFIGVAAGLVALCAFCMPNGEYLLRVAGVQGGIGPFMNRNHAGIFFAMSSLATLGLFWAGQMTRKTLLSHRQKQLFLVRQLGLFGLFVLLAAAVFYTRSRGAMLSWLGGIFLYCFLCFWAIPPQLKKKLKGVFFTLVALLLTAGWISTHTLQINAYAQRATGASEQTRKMLYRAAFDALKDYPLFGVGIGAPAVMITSYMEWQLPSYVSHLHSDWVECLLSVGYGGGALVLASLLWLLWVFFRRLKKLSTQKQFFFAGILSALGVMCAGSCVDFHFFIPANTLVFCAFAGVLCSPTFYHHHTHQDFLPLWGKILTMVVLLGAMIVPFEYTTAWRLFLFGKGYKTQAKLAAYEEGLSHYPSPYFALRTARAYENAARRTKDADAAQQLRREAHRVAEMYLKKYPKDKKLSRVYVRTRPTVIIEFPAYQKAKAKEKAKTSQKSKGKK